MKNLNFIKIVKIAVFLTVLTLGLIVIIDAINNGANL